MLVGLWSQESESVELEAREGISYGIVSTFYMLDEEREVTISCCKE